MADPAPDLTALAEAIADGADPDWAEAEASARSERERALIGRLRSIAGVAQFQASSTSADIAEFPPALEPPFAWGPLQVQTLIGRGRYGDVYRASDRRLGRDVALKLLRDGSSTAEDDVVEEGRLAARVRHPNVVTIYGAAHDQGRTGVWMELVDGTTLESELTDRGRLDGAALVAVATQLAGALAAVHDAGLVHRDVKATNVFRDSAGRVVLGDFGTGRELSEGDTARRGLAGTPVYLAPEIFRREPATTATDVYSFGVLIFHLATGTFPVTGSSVGEIAKSHHDGLRKELVGLRADLPPGFATVVDRALDPDSSRRFSDGRELAAALADLEAAPRRQRARRITALAAAAVVTIAVAAFWGGRVWNQPPGPAGRTMILMAPFVNDTGDPFLDLTVDALMSRELEAAGWRVAPPGRLGDALRLIGRDPEGPLDLTTIRMAAIRDDGVALAAIGRISRSDGFEVTVQVVEPAADAGGTTLIERAPNLEELPGALRRLAMSIAGSAGGRSVGDRQEFRLTTSSHDARFHYLRGWELRATNEFNAPRPLLDEATAEFDEAIAIDPDFAMAHIMLAQGLEGAARAEARVRHAGEALRLAESGAVTEPERRFIRAKHAQFMANLEQEDPERRRALFEDAIREFDGLLEIAPDYIPALLMQSYLHQGQGRPVEGAEFMARIAALRPYSYVWQARAARAAYDAGGEQEALRIASASADLLTPSAYEMDAQVVLFVQMLPAYVAWQNDDVEQAYYAARAVEIDSSVPESAQPTRARVVADLYLALGRLSDTEALTAEMAPRFAFQTRSILLDIRQDTAGLRALLESAAPALQRSVPSLLIQAGMLDEARQVIGQIGPGTVTIAGGQSLMAGLLALAEGRVDASVPLLAFANDQPLMGNAPWQAPTALARAYQANGQPDAAIAILEDASRRSRAPLVRTPVIRHWLLILDALADAYRDAGRIDDARRVESELRTLLAVADADHPLVVKLRERQ